MCTVQVHISKSNTTTMRRWLALLHSLLLLLRLLLNRGWRVNYFS
jgi:hypothetical protein